MFVVYSQSQLPAMPKSEKSDKSPTYESALAELESIVSRMEDGQLSLEHSLTAYKRGAELLKFCQGQLADAQQQVKVLEAGVLKNFAGDDDDASA
jgi:exodeoxyribonuclease VII small subunit